MVADFHVGDENAELRYLFDDDTIRDLQSISPIVFYGEHGSGKTALSITLGVRWARQNEARPLCFSTAKAFASEFASAIEIDDLESFKTRYRLCKLLIIDDLDALAQKVAAQDELVTTLDALITLQVPVIVSCSKLPPAIANIKPSLSSRLSAGYSILLRRPGVETRNSLVADLVEAIDSFE